MASETPKKQFSLSDLLAKDSIEVEVIHPNEGPTGWFITVRGKASVDYMRTRAELVEASARAGKAALQKTAHYEKLETKLLMAAITGWRGLMDNGVEIPYSPSMAQELLENPQLYWLREFLDNKLQDNASFF